MNVSTVAAEQKYDWGGWHERLRSSRLFVRSICVRKSRIGGAKAPLAPLVLPPLCINHTCKVFHTFMCACMC